MPKGITLKHHKISNIEFVNHPVTQGHMELTNKYSYNVKYLKNNLCCGEMTLTVSDKNAPEKFSIKMTVTGIIGLDEAALADKDRVHLETYRTLFPYARTAITAVTAISGIPPIMIPEIDIEDQNIYRVQLPRRDNPSDEES